MPRISPGQLAFSALQYLPVPTLVLNSLKTVVLANEAVGRMLGVVQDDVDEEDASTTLERLRGQTLSQIGIDMLQDGQPVWVTWENFLDNVVSGMGVRSSAKDQPPDASSDHTPTAGTAPGLPRSGSVGRPTQDVVVEVVISRKGLGKTTFDHRYRSRESDYQVFAKMIVTIWELEDKQAYFTLTFTSTQSTPSSLAAGKKSIARPSILEAADRRSISTPSIVQSNPPSGASSRDSNSPCMFSPSAVTMSSSPFPPMGPPSVASQSGSPSLLQKMIRMKDALIDNTQMPILAMWKDGSVTYPNRAARRLIRKDADLDSSLDGFELLKNWEVWCEDFTERLDVSQYPISVLLRTGTPFPSIRIGVYDENGEKVVFDVLGEVIRDDATGEFLAGVVTGRDVTSMKREISEIKERDEERFRLICDTIPQFVWTARPDGGHDFFNSRWYSYTGLTPDQCLGFGWQTCFHPEDIPQSFARWRHSLATGEQYTAEFRCRSKDGEWRWFLSRAQAVRDKDTGDIEKWFGMSMTRNMSRHGSRMLTRGTGTCADIHETMETKLSAKRTRQQLLSVIAHAHVTIFTTDVNRNVTMLEGALIWDSTGDESRADSRWFIGRNIYYVFNRLTECLSEGEQPHFLQPIEDCLNGKISEDTVAEEHQLSMSLSPTM
jgi:PAS domain S-box-containing protein